MKKYFLSLILLVFLFAVSYAQNSILSTGYWVKISIDTTGIYKLPYDTLLVWGFKNPDQIAIFGNGGAQLEANTRRERQNSINEIATYQHNGTDSVFGRDDYYLFYAEGTITNHNKINIVRHEYEKQSYYYITEKNNGRKIEDYPLPEIGDKDTVKTHTSSYYYSNWNSFYQNNSTHIYGSLLYPNQPITLHTGFEHFISDQYPRGFLKIENVHGIIGKIKCTTEKWDTVVNLEKSTSINLNNKIYENPMNLTITLMADEGSESCLLTSVELHLTEKNIFTAQPKYFNFENFWSISDSCYVYINTEQSNIRVWNLEDKFTVKNIPLTKINNGFVFPFTNLTRESFVCFVDSTCSIPNYMGQVENQNLQGASSINYLIITHPDFKTQAKRLAEFRNKTDGFSTFVANTNEIYNEYSSGKVDPVAIRDFIKTIYDKGKGSKDSLKYLVLFGDGIIDCYLADNITINFIPVYLSYIQGDNLYGVMENLEDYFHNGNMDLAIGRLPARTEYEATIMVDKLIRHENDKGFWRNRIALVASEVDYNQEVSFFKTVDYFASQTTILSPHYTLNKIYFDAFNTKIQANDSLVNLINSGQSLIGYFGHSNTKAWAGVFNLETIDNLHNAHLPIVISQSCNYAEFDKKEHCAAEKWLLHKTGGAVAVIGGANVMYGGHIEFDSQNINLLNIISNFQDYNTIGEFMIDKDCSNSEILLGDPATKLGIVNPSKTEITINDENEAYWLKGAIVSDAQTPFNGIIYFSFYQPIQTQMLLDCHFESFTIKHQNDLLFLDSSIVVNGEFNYMLPNDSWLFYKDSIKLTTYAISKTNEAVGLYYLPKLKPKNSSTLSMVFPTLTHNEFTISTLPQVKISAIKIYDTLGNLLIYIQPVDLNSNKISISSLNSGMYFIAIHYGNNTYETFRIIKI